MARKTKLPFSDEDLVGPQEWVPSAWTVTMRRWQAWVGLAVARWLEEGAGGPVKAVQLAPKPVKNSVYLRVCKVGAHKAHQVHPVNGSCGFHVSLHSSLLALGFSTEHGRGKVTFRCQPETYGTERILVINVKGYTVVDEEDAGPNSASPGADT